MFILLIENPIKSNTLHTNTFFKLKSTFILILVLQELHKELILDPLICQSMEKTESAYVKRKIIYVVKWCGPWIDETQSSAL